MRRVTLEMPVRHPHGNTGSVVGYMRLEFKGKVWARDKMMESSDHKYR